MNTTTETVQHTPTPWRVGPFGGIYGEQDGPCIISATHSDGGRRANAYENEAFIVRACNNHEALVKLLQDIANEVCAFPEGPRPYSADSYLPESFHTRLRKALLATATP